ncbi:hypothetical protein [Streptomyces sp. SS]|uniref:hypothetical protein n=1 Tax=Streptomyces sp. SS TaxID=260742 RepID=UPI0002E596E3|nr:hypothetical protein [Streptomyces sp. SS]
MGPLLPTGTALAATPPPSASTAPAPDPTPPAPEPSATPDPTPDPTTDPTPAPTPTVEPTPDPTAGTCPVLPLAPFGDPGDAVGRVTLGPRGSACFTVTVEKPGLHQVQGGENLSLSLSSGGTPVGCNALSHAQPCDLAVGTYRLDVVRPGDYSGEAAITVIPLMTGPGCTGPDSTDIGAAPATGTAAGELGIVCHSFTATPGALVKANIRPTEFANVRAWITDSTGKWLCNTGYTCVLPDGTDGYRVLAHLDAPVPYTLKVRRLSDPVGCAVASVTAYGSAPIKASPPCSTFTPATTGSYEVKAVSANGSRTSVEMYSPDDQVCKYYDACTFTAGITYTLITDDALQILDLRSPEGCADVVLAQPRWTSLAVPGVIDCVNLPVPQGSQVAVLTGRSAGESVWTDVRVLDATGALLCWTEEELSAGACSLDGTAPYRALVERGSTSVTGSYGLVVHRTDVASDCRTFPAGGFGVNPAGAAVTTESDSFADCLTIPADSHSGRELLQIDSALGGNSLGFTVLDENGHRVCRLGAFADNVVDCPLTPGLSHTVLLGGKNRPTEHTLVRRDVTGTARGCVETPATRVGDPALDGVPAEPGTLLCHRVTTADERDTLHLNARYTAAGLATGFNAYSANGEIACTEFAAGCAVTGSTAYQAIVRVGRGDTTAPAYRFDAFRIGTAAGPAPECVKGPDVTYGFGLSVGTLTEQKPALCVVLPTGAGDWFRLALTPKLDLKRSPTPWFYDPATRRNGCPRAGSYSYYTCEVPEAETYGRYSRPTTLVIGMPSLPTQAPTETSVTATCQYRCGPVLRTVTSVSPGTVGAGKITMEVTGAALHENDVVEVSGGTYRARSTTVSITPDRQRMEVSLDLTGAPRTALSLSLLTHDSVRYPRGTVTVVAPLSATVAPSVTGIAVLGGTVAAKAGTWSPVPDAYAYQWLANGVAIAGATATTYALPPELFGKQLSVAVTARKAGHPVVTATSGAVVVKGVAPKPTKVPAMSGATRVGSKVTAVVGTWSPAPTSYAYQWRANGVAIAGATGSSYVPVATVLGKKLTVTVTALRTGHLNGAYTTVGYTVAAGLAPKATSAPYVSGTVRVGRTLTVNKGVWTPAPGSYTYQWYANGRAISGATKSWFTLTKTQRGTRITVKVTAYRTGHTAGIAWTRSTVAVAG